MRNFRMKEYRTELETLYGFINAFYEYDEYDDSELDDFDQDEHG